MTFNAETYAHDLLRVCGGENVFAERERQFPLKADLGEAEPLAPDDPRVAGRDTRYPRVTLAEVEAAQPDVILLPSEPFPFLETAHADLRRARHSGGAQRADSPGRWIAADVARHADGAGAQSKFPRLLCERVKLMQEPNSWVEIVGEVAHELKTPITSAKGFIDLIVKRGDPLNERQEHFSERALAALEHMESLVARLLEMAWIDAERPLEPQQCDLAAVIEGAVIDAAAILPTAARSCFTWKFDPESGQHASR